MFGEAPNSWNGYVWLWLDDMETAYGPASFLKFGFRVVGSHQAWRIQHSLARYVLLFVWLIGFKWGVSHTSLMGALDKRVISGIAVLAALLFIVSAVMLFTGDKSLASDDSSIALYILILAGFIAILYSAGMIVNGDSFVRKLTGVLIAVAGILFIAVKFSGESADTVMGIAGLLAGLGLVLDMLALWVSRIYGAMYVSAVLAAIDIVMGAMLLMKDYNAAFVLALLIAFAVWLVISSFVSGFVNVESGKKTREIVESPRAQKKEKPQAQNKKATPKAKKTEPKPVSEKKAEEPVKAEEPKKVRTVELPKTPVAQAAIQKTQVRTTPAEESVKAEEPKQEQKAPAKAMSDFMQKLMSSQDANRVVKKEAEPEVPAPVVKDPVVEEKVEPVVEEPAEPEVPAEEPVEVAPSVVVEVPETSVISEPVIERADDEDDVFQTPEPNWAKVTEDSSTEEVVRIRPAPAPVEEPAEEPEDVPAPVEETVQPQEDAVEPVPAPVEEAPAEPVAVVEEVPREIPKPVEVEVPETSVISEPIAESEPTSEPAPNWDDVSSVTEESEAAEQTEDIYTDNSPEALVRRAAWNKGLRCRRGYGERNIPVAFVKGKVAVYVDDAEPDTAADDELRAEGWTVLRYRASDITDGKAQGDEIAAAVKENTKAAGKKKKAKK